MSKKNVLIAYGTRYGSARIVASDIAEHLERKGHGTTLLDLRREAAPKDLASYDFIIAGSSVAMFSWVGKVKGFLRKCVRSGAATAVYITCGTAIDSVEKARTRFLEKVLARTGLNPAATGIVEPVIDFRPGEGIPEPLKSRIKGTVAAMAKDSYAEDGLMDFRDKGRFESFLSDLDGALA